MLAATFVGYVGLAVMGVICLVIGSVALTLSKILGPSRPTRVKALPYECGVELLQPTARERYSIHFYLVAILFILFDLETVFLFPWAATMRYGVDPNAALLRGVLLTEVLLFVGILAVGLFYVWKRRGLEWD